MKDAVTICLNMIVKNEEHVIARCLKSVRSLIDYYVIVDTGSTDKTKEIIRETLKGIPGEIIDRPWKNFGHNRTEAIHLAAGKADYLLVVDADDEIVGVKPTFLDGDTYHLKVEDGDISYHRAQLFRADKSYRYVGVLHEYLETSNKNVKNAFLPTLKYIRHHNGASWGQGDVEAMKAKYTRDATILEAGLIQEPNNARYAFYLAQSWRDAGEIEKAIECYERRTKMIGWDEEKWYSLFQIAVLKRQIIKPSNEVIEAFLKAYEDRPTRIESMYELGRYLQVLQRHQLCYQLLKPLVDAPLTKDRLFVNVSNYIWGLKDVLAGSAFLIGDIVLAEKLNSELLSEGHLPANEIDRVTRNRARCKNDTKPVTKIINKPPLKIAVITPTHNTPQKWLDQCHLSVINQTYPCTHIIIDDGSAIPVEIDGVQILRLPKGHADTGNAARAIGSVTAACQDFDAIAYLDSDNWYEPTHIESLVNLFYETGSIVCTSTRNLYTLEDKLMGVCPEVNGKTFVDTNCMMFMKDAYKAISLWYLMPPNRRLWGDRYVWDNIVQNNMSTSYSKLPTVCYRTSYKVHYNYFRVPAPKEAK